MSNLSDEEVRACLSALIEERGHRFEDYFREGSGVSEIVAHLRARYEYIHTLVTKTGSVEAVLGYLEERRRLQEVVPDDSINSIPLTSFVLPHTGRQSAPNGLCALPSRLDTLTGPVQVFPQVVCDSDLVNRRVESEWIPPMEMKVKTLPFEVSFKKIRVKELSD